MFEKFRLSRFGLFPSSAAVLTTTLRFDTSFFLFEYPKPGVAIENVSKPRDLLSNATPPPNLFFFDTHVAPRMIGGFQESCLTNIHNPCLKSGLSRFQV